VLAAVIVVVFLVGFIALGVVIGLLVVGVLVVAVDRLLLALSPKTTDPTTPGQDHQGWSSKGSRRPSVHRWPRNGSGRPVRATAHPLSAASAYSTLTPVKSGASRQRSR